MMRSNALVNLPSSAGSRDAYKRYVKSLLRTGYRVNIRDFGHFPCPTRFTKEGVKQQGVYSNMTITQLAGK